MAIPRRGRRPAPPGRTARVLAVAALTLPLVACETSALISPAQDVVITTAWVPVQLEIPRSAVGRGGSMRLDGERVSDPLALTRDRATKWGGQADYLATLDLRDVAPGEHTLSVSYGGYSEEVTFTFEPPACRVQAFLSDERGEPIPGRVLVLQDGERFNLGNPATAIDPRDRDRDLDAIYVLRDGGVGFLPCGDYTLVGVQDLRRGIDRQDVRLTADTTVLRFTLPRLLETPGEVASDLHMHTGHSQDAFLTDRLRAESLIASGLDVVVVTEHDQVHDLTETLQAVAGAHAPTSIPGIESDMHLPDDSDDGWGSTAHINAFPLPKGLSLPRQTAQSAEAWIARWRTRNALTDRTGLSTPAVLQVNHPRGIQFKPTEEPNASAWALFTQLGFDPAVAPGEGTNAWMTCEDPDSGVRAMDFDTLELMNRFSPALYEQVREDWFALLDHGWVLTATGNSDSHGLVIEAPGFPLNLVHAPRPDTPERLDQWLDAVRSGQVRVSSGPLVSLTIVDDQAHVRVQAVPWVPVQEVRLVVNNSETLVPLDLSTQGAAVLDRTLVFDLPQGVDLWVVAEAGWPVGARPEAEELGLYAQIAPGHVPTGFTNPTFLDGDGSGAWHGPREVVP